MIVYKIKNKVDGKMYIGQTIKTLEARWYAHCRAESDCRYLKHAIKKHGKDLFEVSIISTCSSMEEMNHRESYYIKLFNTISPNGYNLTSGGNNKKASEETKLKQSKSMKKAWQNKRENWPSPKGKKQKPSDVLKRTNALIGLKQSIETRQKQSESKKKLYEAGYINPRKGKSGEPNSGSFGNGRVAPLTGRRKVIIDGKIRYVKENHNDL